MLKNKWSNEVWSESLPEDFYDNLPKLPDDYIWPVTPTDYSYIIKVINRCSKSKSTSHAGMITLSMRDSIDQVNTNLRLMQKYPNKNIVWDTTTKEYKMYDQEESTLEGLKGNVVITSIAEYMSAILDENPWIIYQFNIITSDMSKLFVSLLQDWTKEWCNDSEPYQLNVTHFENLKKNNFIFQS